MDGSKCVVVVPTNRGVLPDRLRGIPDGVPIFVVADSPAVPVVARAGLQVFDLDAQRRVMGADYDLIPRGTAACRNFGFYYAWRYTDCRTVVSVDDDVATRAGFLEAYDVLGTCRDMDTATGTPWFNPMDLFVERPRCFARGFPFEERVPSRVTWTRSRGRIVCHMGLWDRTLDTHAIDKQLLDAYRQEYPHLTLDRPLVRIGTPASATRVPMSSMNFGFVRDLLPAMYQIPMRRRFTGEYPLWRYDDIWAGYIAQTLIARRGEAMTVGGPIVEHQKVVDLERETAGEHYGILMSPWVYGVLDEAASHLSAASYEEMVADLADRVIAVCDRFARLPALYAMYLKDLAAMLRRWAALCQRSAV